jgi:REase_AHJR-like
MTRSDTAVDRRRRQVAAEYRKQGYHVTKPAASGVVPVFLRGCQPDLIAERDDDKVVIEVKRSNVLRGNNDLVELAERVAASPGWRLEVVALRGEEQAPDLAVPDWLNSMLRRRGSDGNEVFQCIYLVEVMEYLIRSIALRNNFRVRDKSSHRIAAELVYDGIIDQELLDRIGAVNSWRDALMHRKDVPRPAADQVAEIESVCRDLLAQSMIEA